MKFLTFRDKVRPYPVFRSSLLDHLSAKPAILRRQVSEWIKKGYIVPLKRGIYTLKQEEQTARFSTFFLANFLYHPSYISLESALSYYGIIPERVYSITSITSKKTQKFENSYGKFIYHHIKPEWYNDFIIEKDEHGQSFFIATKERALIDFFYLRIKFKQHPDEDIFSSSYRFQNIEDINRKKLIEISSQFKIKKIDILVNLFLKFMEQ